MDILVIFLVGAIVVAILMHLHFRNATDVRVAVVSPPVFAVIGTLVGISAGMMWLWVGTKPAWDGRIFIEQGVAHALAGAAVGAIVGTAAKGIFERWSRTRAVGFALTLVLLGTSIGAPIGWLYGDIRRHRLEDDATVEAVQSTQSGMLWGAAVGCLVGLTVGLLETRSGSRRHKGEATAAATS